MAAIAAASDPRAEGFIGGHGQLSEAHPTILSDR
eukprot:SAG31_NODE_40103_length_283_cov_0.836957_1_plen_33_part_10